MEWINLAYLLSAVLFILGLRGLGHPDSARRGSTLAALGMLVAVIATLLHKDIITYQWIIIGLIAGSLIGIPMGLWIPITKMPERIALSHSFGGLAVAIVGLIKYLEHAGTGHLPRFTMGAVGFEVLLGTITFTGSLMAFGKLQGILPSRPMLFRFQNFLNGIIFFSSLAIVATLIVDQNHLPLFNVLLCLGLLLGILFVLPIGGADMPVVICLLNSYAGLAASATGFALENNVLIICGALDGGSGFILAMLMSKAMNRSFSNVLFGGFGAQRSVSAKSTSAKPVVEMSIPEATEILRAANSVVVVPGYGLAVAQAQHVVRELAELLEKNGTEVRYAIHPVAGRMPGHMNILLAEANVPYEQLVEMDNINPTMETVDVCVVIGANDVVNPAARHNKSSPIYGMPIINADKAKTVFVLKRSMATGFAGIENDLFTFDNTRMLFGDAKATIQSLITEFKSND